MAEEATPQESGALLPRMTRTKKVIIGALAGVIAIVAMACVDATRLEVETGDVTYDGDGIVIDVVLRNTGESQDIISVEQGLIAVDATGKTWRASDACSTLDGQTVTERRPISGTLCFPYERLDAEGMSEDYVPRDTRLTHLMLTDNMFVDDTDNFYIHALEAEKSSGAARIEVTVWQNVETGELYLSTRPEGGRWTTHQEPLDMSRMSPSGRFRQGDGVTVEAPSR